MQVHNDIGQLPVFRKGVLTIGTFDGVHKGHQQILRRMKEEAVRIGGETIVISFHPHPRKIIDPEASLQLINTIEEKTMLLGMQGIDHMVIVPFTKEFAQQSAEEYIRNFVINRFHPHTIIIGYDHHFGRNREGNFSLMEQMKGKYGYQLIEIPRHVLHEIGVSSTTIRESIRSGDISTANELLGYPFFFSGRVVAGDKLGRQLGYPTANLEYTDADKIHLGQGVYAATAVVNDETRDGMLSVGNRPTLNDHTERIEINLFDFDSDIYGLEIEITVIAWMRPQEKYDSLDALKAQLKKDETHAKALLSA